VPFHIGEDRFATIGAELADRAGRLAREAAGDSGARVAGCLPPLFGSDEPQRFDADRAPAMLDQLIAAQSPYVDMWLAETTSSLEEAQAAAMALAGDDRPLWISFTLRDDTVDAPLLRSGETVADAAKLARDVGAEAILFNCSQPEVMERAIAIAAEVAGTALRVGVYANAFDDHKDDGDQGANDKITELRKDLSPTAYVDWANIWVKAGATIVGGCCGIGSTHIAALREHFAD